MGKVWIRLRYEDGYINKTYNGYAYVRCENGVEIAFDTENGEGQIRFMLDNLELRSIMQILQEYIRK